MKRTRNTGTTRGFSRAVSLMQTRIRKASEGRGFAESRVLTHWPEIVGEEIAQTASPVKVSYPKGGIGAKLTLLTTGAHAPILEMQKDAIREKVNRCYGYSAISRIEITQTAPVGFSDGRVEFQPKQPLPVAPDTAACLEAEQTAKIVQNDNLREALERLGAQVISKHRTNQRSQ